MISINTLTMPGKTQYYSNAVLNVLRNTAVSAIATPYVGLFSTALADNSHAGTELTGNGYARQAVTFGAPTQLTVNSQQIANTNTITFGPATGSDWLQAVAFGVWDAATNGNLLYWNTLTTAKTIQVGDSGVWAASALTISED